VNADENGTLVVSGGIVGMDFTQSLDSKTVNSDCLLRSLYRFFVFFTFTLFGLDLSQSVHKPGSAGILSNS